MDFASHSAFRWNNAGLVPITFSHDISGMQLIGLDSQAHELSKNILYFTKGNRALNVLLWGEKGAGKSTLIRLMLRDYSSQGFRIIEFCSKNYYEIYDIYSIVREHPNYYFALYFDDVSFDDNDERYRNFKSIVEGGLEEKPDNLIFIATSNRRHLVCERAFDTNDIYSRDDENESSSLFARFAMTIGFYPLNQESYLNIVKYYLDKLDVNFDGWQKESISFAMNRGGRSGRAAQQFAVYQKILRQNVSE